MPVHRLDAELVRRGLARSREQARTLIASGRVAVRGMVAHKAASGVAADTPIRVREDDSDPGYASRGGHKLASALDAFPITVAGRRCLDAGASTGGFTDVLLRAGAAEVVAVDVGYGQLAWSLRTDSRVHVHDRTNVRALTPDQIGGPVDLVVADLSFISLRLVLPALLSCATAGADVLPMVKPQFEVGHERIGRGGVVRDPQHRVDAVLDVAHAAAERGWPARGLCVSALPGPSGNVEFFLWLRKDRAGAAPPPIDDAAMAGLVLGARSGNATALTGGSAEAGERPPRAEAPTVDVVESTTGAVDKPAPATDREENPALGAEWTGR